MTQSPEASVIAALVTRARAAQAIADGYDQAGTDRLVAAAAWAILEPRRNRALAELAVRDDPSELAQWARQNLAEYWRPWQARRRPDRPARAAS